MPERVPRNKREPTARRGTAEAGSGEEPAVPVTSFAGIREQFDSYIGDIVYATMTTVDRRGRPGPGC